MSATFIVSLGCDTDKRVVYRLITKFGTKARSTWSEAYRLSAVVWALG